jgi:hypothetical protein
VNRFARDIGDSVARALNDYWGGIQAWRTEATVIRVPDGRYTLHIEANPDGLKVVVRVLEGG